VVVAAVASEAAVMAAGGKIGVVRKGERVDIPAAA